MRRGRCSHVRRLEARASSAARKARAAVGEGAAAVMLVVSSVKAASRAVRRSWRIVFIARPLRSSCFEWQYDVAQTMGYGAVVINHVRVEAFVSDIGSAYRTRPILVLWESERSPWLLRLISGAIST